MTDKEASRYDEIDRPSDEELRERIDQKRAEILAHFGIEWKPRERAVSSDGVR